MAKLSSLRVDPALSQNGIWLTFEGDVRVKLARMSNPRAEKRKRELILAYQERTGVRNIPLDDAEDIGKQVIAECIMLDWDGVDAEDGTGPEKYAPEKGLAVLRDEAQVDFYNWVVYNCNSRERYRSATREQSVGNSKAASTGSLNGEVTLTSSAQG